MALGDFLGGFGSTAFPAIQDAIRRRQDQERKDQERRQQMEYDSLTALMASSSPEIRARASARLRDLAGIGLPGGDGKKPKAPKPFDIGAPATPDETEFYERIWKPLSAGPGGGGGSAPVDDGMALSAPAAPPAAPGPMALGAPVGAAAVGAPGPTAAPPAPPPAPVLPSAAAAPPAAPQPFSLSALMKNDTYDPAQYDALTARVTPDLLARRDSLIGPAPTAPTARPWDDPFLQGELGDRQPNELEIAAYKRAVEERAAREKFVSGALGQEFEGQRQLGNTMATDLSSAQIGPQKKAAETAAELALREPYEARGEQRRADIALNLEREKNEMTLALERAKIEQGMTADPVRAQAIAESAGVVQRRLQVLSDVDGRVARAKASMAVGGEPLEEQDEARLYIQAIRQLGVQPLSAAAASQFIEGPAAARYLTKDSEPDFTKILARLQAGLAEEPGFARASSISQFQRRQEQMLGLQLWYMEKTGKLPPGGPPPRK